MGELCPTAKEKKKDATRRFRARRSTARISVAPRCALCGKPISQKSKYGVCTRRKSGCYSIFRALAAAASRARKVGLPFSLTATDVLPVPEFCPILGLPLSFATGQRTDNSPSIDRIDPGKGYVEGNWQWLSWRANRIKNDGSVVDILLIGAHEIRQQKLPGLDVEIWLRLERARQDMGVALDDLMVRNVVKGGIVSEEMAQVTPYDFPSRVA